MRMIGKMKLFAVICIMVLSASAASAASTEDGKAYFGFNGGVLMPTDSKVTDNVGDTADIEFDTGYSLSAFGGYEFGSGLRLEGELTFKQADMDKFKFGPVNAKINSDASIFGALANVYFDFKNSSPVTPYIGGGIGVATVYVGKGTAENGALLWNEADDTVFAYQAGAGIGFDVTSNVTLDLGYRYFATSDIKFEQLEAEFASHIVLAGIRFKF